MKMMSISKYFISLILILVSGIYLQAQEENTQETDSIVVIHQYGLRLGTDLSKLARTFLETDYSGFEINGDYRLTELIFIAGALGSEERTIETDYLNSTATGSYFKGGFDINLYDNWAGMENLIYSGVRFGFSNFNQTLNSYTIYDVNSLTWGPKSSTESEKFSGLTAGWIEVLLGFKAEVLNNLFLGFNVQIKRRIFETEPENFENLYIPGFGRTFDSGVFGVGFGYNISYLIPLYKKAKK